MGWCSGTQWFQRLRWLVCLLAVGHYGFLDCAAVDPNQDDCDWTGSGLEQSVSNQDQGIIPVYLHCNQGLIEWQYPREGLRILLHPRRPSEHFWTCLRIAANSSGASVYLQGHRRLLPVFKGYQDGNEPRHDVMRCFASYKGQNALYIEAEHSVSHYLLKDVVRIWYHLTPVASQSELLDDMAECRPCAEEELIHSYCTSDFVAEGVVSNIHHVSYMDSTLLTVEATNVLRDSSPPVFKMDFPSQQLKGVLHRPLKCGTKAGTGKFLFLGTLVLGHPVVKCVPRIQEWHSVRKRSRRKGTSPCTLH